MLHIKGLYMVLFLVLYIFSYFYIIYLSVLEFLLFLFLAIPG